MRRPNLERGAVAVEFALLLPLLLLILFAIIELGHAYNVQISVTHASREAARTMAITKDWTDAKQAAVASSPSLSPAKHRPVWLVSLSKLCSPTHFPA